MLFLGFRDSTKSEKFQIPEGPSRAHPDPNPHWGWDVRSVPDGDDLAKVQLVVVDLGDEDGSHSLIERSAVHVDGGTHGQHKASNAPVNVIVLQ